MRRPGRRRRWIVRGVVCFVLGCATTVGASILHAWIGSRSESILAFSYEERDGSLWRIMSTEAFGWEAATIGREHRSLEELNRQDHVDGGPATRERDLGNEVRFERAGRTTTMIVTDPRTGEERRFTWRRGTGLDWWHRIPPPDDTQYLIRAWGWPLPSIRSTILVGGAPPEVLEGIELAGDPSKLLPPVLPTRPLWRGIALNGIVLGGLWFVLLLGAAWMRTRVRTLRGRCTHCAYEVCTTDTPVCPECGTPIRLRRAPEAAT